MINEADRSVWDSLTEACLLSTYLISVAKHTKHKHIVHGSPGRFADDCRQGVQPLSSAMKARAHESSSSLWSTLFVLVVSRSEFKGQWGQQSPAVWIAWFVSHVSGWHAVVQQSVSPFSCEFIQKMISFFLNKQGFQELPLKFASLSRVHQRGWSEWVVLLFLCVYLVYLLMNSKIL